MTLVDQFLSLKCAPDVLAACGRIHNPSKEISEAMALIKVVKGPILREPMKRHLVDLCAGHAMTSLIAVHLLPVATAIAVDIKPRDNGRYLSVKRFSYLKADIYDDFLWAGFLRSTIFVSAHPCGELAKRILHFRELGPMAVMPCCLPRHVPETQGIVRKRLGRYVAWALALAEGCGGKVPEANGCLSPCNLIVTKGL